MSSTSSPLNVTLRPVTLYRGRPARAYAWVDLPEPLGPIRAWTLPASTVRSTPRRICLSSTSTWRSSITRVVSGISLLRIHSQVLGQLGPVVGQVDEHVLALDPHREDPHRAQGRWAVGLAGEQVEAAAVQGALDGRVLDPALGQRVLLVAAHIDHGVDAAVAGADQGDRLLVAELDPEPLVGFELREPGQPNERHHPVSRARTASVSCASWAASAAASSASRAASSRRRTAGTVTWARTSSKNPNTTSRLAVRRGMPRDSR